MAALELTCAAIVTFWLFIAWRDQRPWSLLRQYLLLALSAWSAEESCIRLYGFYGYDPGWNLWLGHVPLLVVLIWPVVILSSLGLARHLAPARRVPLLAGALVLADAALIEPVSVRAGLWRWYEPGLFEVPPIGVLGWAILASLAVAVLERNRRHGRSWRWDLLLPLVAPLATHLLLLACWWGCLRWLSRPLPAWPAAALAWILGLVLVRLALVRRLSRRLPLAQLVSRMPAALFFTVLLVLHGRDDGALVAWVLAFTPPYLAITPWRGSWRGPGRRAGKGLAGLAVLLLAGCGDREQGAQRKPEFPVPAPALQQELRPSVILVVIDTLRADHLRAWGYARDTMPALERLAARGVLFQHAIAPAPWTLPSVVSILSGIYPSAHGVNAARLGLPRGVATLQEVLGDAGYQTAFFGVNSYFSLSRQMDRGFESWQSWASLRAPDLNRSLAAFVAQERDPARPLFLYLHYFDPHCPYQAPRVFRGRFDPVPEDRRSISPQDWARMAPCFQLQDQAGQPQLALAAMETAYDEELSHVDHALATVLNAEVLGEAFEQSLVLVTGDHGEEFWEHGDYGHGRSLWQASLHVPLVIRPPGGCAPRSHEQPVSLTDIAPTVVSALGLPVPASWQGRDLSGLWTEGDEGERGPVFAETGYGRQAHVVIEGQYKLLQPEQGASLLFDLQQDPGERRDLLGQRPALAARLEELLEEHLACSGQLTAELGLESLELEDGWREGLEELGYLE